MSILGTEPNLPNYTRPEYLHTAPDLKLIEDELGGTRAMHAASNDYVRKWKAEKDHNYNWRRVCETFFEGLGRTLSAAVGMIFAKPPSLVWNASEAAMEAHWANVDAAGTAGPVFAKRFGEAALRDGLALLLIDHPPPPEGVPVTAANEEMLNLRPTWAMYSRSSIINWQAERVNNTLTLTLLVFHEPTPVRDGLYGTKTVHRFRVLRLLPTPVEGTSEPGWRAAWLLLETSEDQPTALEHFRQVGAGVFSNKNGDTASRLPISIAYTGRTDAPMQAKIPLLGVAWANLSHWQLSTDLRFNTLVAALALPTVKGRFMPTDDGTQRGLEIGPLTYVHLEADGDFKWSEPSGSGLERLAKLVLVKLTEIAQQGLSFLQTDTRAAETAEAKRLDAAAENATLATAAQGIEDALNAALEIHAWYLGIPKEGAPVVTLSRDYEDTTIQSDVMSAYLAAVTEAGLPIRVMLQAWQQGGRIPSDTDLDALEREMEAKLMPQPTITVEPIPSETV